MALGEARPETVDVIDSAEPDGGDGPAGRAASSVQRYPVAPGVQLKVRSGPGTAYRLVRVLPVGARVPINCQKPGERISGPYGTTNIWDCIGNGEYVSDAYVRTGSDGYVTVPCS
ncbi:peptidase [Streptomyces sp. CAU 1734]|uniref:peptidase n=1 Tax=Streptomyces sp. CAU 1734 TaxID=3140360 RepID=UPI0032605528